MRRGPAGERTRRGNFYEVAVIGGTAASAWLGGAVAARVGWRGGFGLAAACIAVAWAIAAWRVVPAARPVLGPAPPVAVRPGSRTALPRATLLGIYLAAFALAVAWAGGITTFLPLYGGRGLGLTADVLGKTLSVAYVIEACLLVPVGWAADAWGRIRVLVPGFLVMLAGVVLVPATSTVVGFGLGATLLVAGITAWMVPPVLLAERLPGGFRGPAAGVYRVVADLAYLVSPGAVGWLVGRHGFRAAGLAMAGLFLAAAVTAVALLGRRPESA
jgi:MFS family permease